MIFSERLYRLEHRAEKQSETCGLVPKPRPIPAMRHQAWEDLIPTQAPNQVLALFQVHSSNNVRPEMHDTLYGKDNCQAMRCSPRNTQPTTPPLPLRFSLHTSHHRPSSKRSLPLPEAAWSLARASPPRRARCQRLRNHRGRLAPLREPFEEAESAYDEDEGGDDDEDRGGDDVDGRSRDGRRGGAGERVAGVHGDVDDEGALGVHCVESG